ncbi:guanine nucleotide-binding protein-like 3 homolog [Condylostylus longicornis]|uniref:guanine nucleotide-binding protein-like 3 homolog n=1 Tax=Condylostylus longicornis TaxID=2530218 RepID=UPI00244E4434|nr:guanine nucleotide-binding protein-like 3 homolog [Condylostylus longicornis]
MGKKKNNNKYQNKRRNNIEKFSVKKAEFKQKNEQAKNLKKRVSDQIKSENQMDIEDQKTSHFDEIKQAIKDNTCKVFNKEFRKVVSQADILLEILDARDPLGTRCNEIEKIINESPEQKPIIVVLNKADLVPIENLRKWLKYFKTIHPAIPFKSSTQKQALNYGSKSFKSVKDEKCLQNSVSFGTDLLMSMLGKYFRHKGAGVKITVGVVGIPNVGKSSIINSLARGRRCAVGCKPGVTRSLQKIQIDKKVMLIDSPGIIFPSAQSLCSVYQNGQNVSDIKDPVRFAENILKRATKQYFCNLYGISDYNSFEEFLSRKALKMGKFSNGSPDIEAAARGLLNDWNSGKIRYNTEPPEESSCHVSSKIITNNETVDVNMDCFDDDIEQILKSFEEKPVEVETTFKVPEESIYNIANNAATNNKVKATKNLKIDPEALLQGNKSINKEIKRLQKKKKKMVAKTERRIDQMSDVLEGFSIKSEDCMTDDKI